LYFNYIYKLNTNRLIADRASVLSTAMRPITIYLPESYIKDLDELIENDLYPNRGDVVRSAIRDLLIGELWENKNTSRAKQKLLRGPI